MSFSGSRIGPGPASLNIRTNLEPKFANVSTMGTDSRRLDKGMVLHDHPSPGHYTIIDTKNTISNGKLFNA